MGRDKSQENPPTPTPPEAEFLGMPAEVTRLLKGESERGAILILGAYLDEILGLLIRAACISERAATEILQWRKPAGDFDSKIVLCHAFGLIHTEDLNALRIVKKIRNSAAHFDRRSGGGFNVLFDASKTVDQVAAFAALFRSKLPDRRRETVRAYFETCSRLLAIRLFFRLAAISRAPEPQASKGHADAIRERIRNSALGEAMLDVEQRVRSGDMSAIKEIIDALKNARAKRRPGSETSAGSQ